MPTTETRRLNPYALTAIVLAAVALVIFAIRSFTRDIVEIRASAVTHQNLLSTVSTNGRVEPIEQFQAHAPAAGVVTKLYVDGGQKVKKGELLLRMEDTEARAKVATAQSALVSAEAIAGDQAKGGSQEERLAMAGDLTRAQIQQQQAQKDLATLEQLHQKGAA